MKCNAPHCEVDATVHFYLAEKGRIVENAQQFCSAHAKSFWNDVVKRNERAGPNHMEVCGERPFEIDVLAYDEARAMGWVYLRELDGTQGLCAWIAYAEAMAIRYLLTGTKCESKRPSTHGAFLDTMKLLGGQMTHVIIDDYNQDGGYFMAKLMITHGERRLVVDVRPSDAMALALASKTPILVASAAIQRSSGKTGPPLWPG